STGNHHERFFNSLQGRLILAIYHMHKIKLTVYPFNTPAVKAYKKNGFTKEGTFKNEVFYDGKWVDIDHYAIFQNDWYTSQNEYQ
uniref:GNAT family N-acetyltransferase n=1 Tax=Leuconostoc mesenteroides TaxID=1245 RepID=UPI002362F8CD